MRTKIFMKDRQKQALKYCLLFALAAGLAAACAVEQAERVQVGEQSYGETSGTFRGKWWNYFERGLSYTDAAIKADESGDTAAKEKALKLAESDLATAVKMRDEDQRRARTYGMHLIDYFPHRELGIVYFLQGRYGDAIRELEASLASVESAKAQYYLDKARKAQIEGAGGESVAPAVAIAPLPALVRDTEIEVSGSVSDEGYVAEITIGDEPVMVPVSDKKIEFSRKIILEEGENKIDVAARDLMGNEGTASATVVLDTTGPSVTIEEASPAPGRPGSLKIKGWVKDSGGVRKLVVGETEVGVGRDGPFEVTVPAGSDGTVSFMALDEAGNETTGVVGGQEETETEGRLAGPQFAAYLTPGRIWDVTPAGWGYSSGVEFVQAAAPAAAPAGPKIEIKGLTGKQTAYSSSFYVEGWVSDPSGVQSLVVGSRSLIAKPGKKVYFNYLTRLRSGTNTLTFVAKNSQGLASQKAIQVVRVEPRVRQVGSRMVVSMLPFQLRGQVNLSQVAYDNLLKSVAKTGRFKMIDRRVIDKVIRELKLSQAGLTDQVATVKAGKMAQAEVVLLGFVKETPYSIEVYARLVEVESSAILAEKDAYIEGRPISLKDLATLMDGLSVKIRNQFPMVEGQIALLSGKDLTARLKTRVPLRAGMKFIIFHEQQVLHPETKKPLGIQTLPITEARIVSARGSEVRAQILNAKDLKKIAGSDKVITK